MAGYVGSSGAITLSGIAIGEVVAGGTPGSVLFVDAGGNLGQDNAAFNWDDANSRLVFGNESAIRLKSSVGAPFAILESFSTNSGTDNPTLVIGYNVSGIITNADRRIDVTKPAQSLEMEAKYNTGTGVTQMEWNHNFRDVGSVYRRGFVYTIDLATYDQAWQWRGTAFAFANNDATKTKVLVDSGGLAVGDDVTTIPARLSSRDTALPLRLERTALLYSDFIVDTVGNLFINPIGGVTRIGETLRVEGSIGPATGKGVEVGFNPGGPNGFILAFDRDAAAYRALTIDGATLGLNTNTAGAVTIGGTLSVFAAFSIDANKTLVPLVSQTAAMTTGFINIPGAAGAPVGTPGTTTGFPLYYDSTANKLYIYNGGWKKGQVAAVDVIYA